MSRYQKQHYEDVARILTNAGRREDISGGARAAQETIGLLRTDFADLFAADNPAHCLKCGVTEAATALSCDARGGKHKFAYGFDRERFLKACGLEA